MTNWLGTISVTVSLLVSVGTLIYTAVAVRQSKLSAIGALRSAAAAEEQVELSRSQVTDSAQSAHQAEESAELSRLSVLETARQRIYEQSPKPLIVIDGTSCKPIFGGKSRDFPDADTAKRLLGPVAFWDSRFESIYYPIRGVIVNEGSESMRVGLIGVSFISGTTKFVGGNVGMPTMAHPTDKLYLIRPGQAAIFDWWAGGSVDNWVDDYDGDKKAREAMDGTLVCFPGAENKPTTKVILRLHDKPLRPDKGDRRSWAFVELNPPRISIEWKRDYHEDSNLVRQELTGEFWDGRVFWPKSNKR